MATLPPITQLGGNHTAMLEWFWSKLDPNNSGKADASVAAAFLKKSQLREPVLHKIWNMSNPSGEGYLDKQGLFMALRLIAVCQNGKEPSVANMSLSDPPPKLAGLEPPPTTLPNRWIIEHSERVKYETIFQSLQPTNGLLGGKKVRPYMESSKLSNNTLGKIWSLSDVDADGNLDFNEFCVAAKLIYLAQAGEILPATLPSSLIPPSKGSGPTSSNILQATVVTTSLGRASPKLTSPSSRASPKLTSPSSRVSPKLTSPSSIVSPKLTSPSSGSPLPIKANATPLNVGVEWVVTNEMKMKYDGYFQGIDKDHDGYISGDEARSLFMASNLQQAVLAHIWNLCDIEKTGTLNAEQFSLAMYLIAEKVRKKDIPNELTPAMIPPSLRGKGVAITHSSMGTTSTVSTSSTSSSVVATETWGDHLSSSISTTSTTWATPSSSVGNLGQTGELGGFSNDFSAIQDLDNITNDIQSLRKEKSELSGDIKSKQELIQQKKVELEGFQTNIDQATQQREDLEKKREKIRILLDQLNEEKACFEGQIAELKQNCDDEKEEIERLKLQLSDQEMSKRSQAEELDKLKIQLEHLKKEEVEYRKKVELGRVGLENMQNDSQKVKSEINQVRQKLEHFKEEHQSLSTAFTLYPPTSITPGSTPSSSVININDVGQLSSELHVPHQSDHDAISARATVGSSSPVSSLSGFSTNSHLDEGIEEGVPREDKPHQDPFSISSDIDPFAAFSISGATGGATGGDPFGGQNFGGKPSDLSAFDPFSGGGGGTTATTSSNFEPFKSGAVTTSVPTTGEDMFRSDPFSGGVSTTLPPPTSVDPFSGQDPFNLDPFGKGDVNHPTSVSLWGSSGPFDSDPFGQQQTPTDPFTSSDPFGDDLFGVKPSDGAGGGGGGAGGGGAGGSSNPFLLTGGKEDIFRGVDWSKDTNDKTKQQS